MGGRERERGESREIIVGVCGGDEVFRERNAPPPHRTREIYEQGKGFSKAYDSLSLFQHTIYTRPITFSSRMCQR